jgi:hypothetical protein
MKKTISLVYNLFLSSTLFWGVATLNADEVVVKTALELPGYCHMQFPEKRSDKLAWDRPVFDDPSGNVIALFASCDHDPTGAGAITAERRIMFPGFYGDNK